MSDHPGPTPDHRSPADRAPAGSASAPGRWRRLGVLVVVASFVGIWGYVMYLSIFVGRAEPRDRMDDTGWTEAAEETCAAPAERIAALPKASEVDDPTERADLLDRGTEILGVMVTRLDGLVPPSAADEARAVDAWLADYREYLQNRRDYADRFRRGVDEPFRVTDRGGFQIDVLIDDFARVNFMESCETPDDVG